MVVSVPEEETSRPLTELISTTPGSSVPRLTEQDTVAGTTPTAASGVVGVAGRKVLNVVSAGAPGVLVHVMLICAAAGVVDTVVVAVTEAFRPPVKATVWLTVFVTPAASPVTISVTVSPVQEGVAKVLMMTVLPATVAVPHVDGVRVAPVSVSVPPAGAVRLMSALVVALAAGAVGKVTASVQLALVVVRAVQLLVAVGVVGGAAGVVTVAETVVLPVSLPANVTLWEMVFEVPAVSPPIVSVSVMPVQDVAPVAMVITFPETVVVAQLIGVRLTTARLDSVAPVGLVTVMVRSEVELGEVPAGGGEGFANVSDSVQFAVVGPVAAHALVPPRVSAAAWTVRVP